MIYGDIERLLYNRTVRLCLGTKTTLLGFRKDYVRFTLFQITYKRLLVTLWMQLWLRGQSQCVVIRKVAGLIPLVWMSKCPWHWILNPKLLLMCWSAPCTTATTISVCMYV